MTEINKLLDIMARLRDPDGGCPWDLGQDFSSIAPYTVEEAYEVADAIARDDLACLRDELGDLLFQVVFHARMAEEAGAFDFGEVVTAITAKLERRHPHVFGTAAERARGAEAGSWERLKAAERREGADEGGALGVVPLALPALKRAAKLGQRAAVVGFDWPDAGGVRAKVDEELGELDDAIAGGEQERMAEELGDVLFALANLARHLGIDAEAALASGSRKFEQRFRGVEAAADADLESLSPAELDRLWEAQKAGSR